MGDGFSFASGLAGILLLGLAAVPQLLRVLRYGTAGISYPGTVVVTSVDAMWTAWSIGVGLLAPAIGDSLGLAMSVTVLALVVHQQRRSKPLSILGAAGLAATGITLGAFLPMAAGVFAFSLSFLWRTLQLREIFRVPDISGVSVGLWMLNTAGQFAWALHGLAIGNAFLSASTFVLGLFSAVVAAVVLIRRRQRPDSNPHGNLAWSHS